MTFDEGWTAAGATQRVQARRERKQKCTLSVSGPQSDVPLDNRRFTTSSLFLQYSSCSKNKHVAEKGKMWTPLSLRFSSKTLSLVKHRLLNYNKPKRTLVSFCGSHINTHSHKRQLIMGKWKSSAPRTGCSFCSTRQEKRINQTLSTN